MSLKIEKHFTLRLEEVVSLDLGRYPLNSSEYHKLNDLSSSWAEFRRWPLLGMLSRGGDGFSIKKNKQNDLFTSQVFGSAEMVRLVS